MLSSVGNTYVLPFGEWTTYHALHELGRGMADLGVCPRQASDGGRGQVLHLRSHATDTHKSAGGGKERERKGGF